MSGPRRRKRISNNRTFLGRHCQIEKEIEEAQQASYRREKARDSISWKTGRSHHHSPEENQSDPETKR